MLEKAIELANEIPYDPSQERLAAIITDKRGKILSTGKNSYSSSCKLQRFYAKCVGLEDKVFSHAEIDALRNLPEGAKPYRIFIARTNRKGEPLLAKPCKICSYALQQFGVIVIHYTT